VPTNKKLQTRDKSSREKKTGLIFDIKRYAIHDGPSIRTTIFFKGCPLSCWWCHNPEGQLSGLELMIWPNRCIGCRTCVSTCGSQAISIMENSIVTDRDKCKMCGVCAEKCPTKAREVVGKWVSVNELMQEVEKDLLFYEGSGGVTLSGGEPLAQPVFLDALLNACRKKNIHTALDTCGYADKEILIKIHKNVDLFLYDLKVMDDRKHKLYTGVSNKQIMKNLELLNALGKNIIIRFPLIPYVNSSKDSILAICKFISKLQNIKEIDVLPYHRLGIEKAKRLNKEAKTFEKPSDELLQNCLEVIKNFGFEPKIGG